MRWKHPSTIALHCPKHLVSGGMRGHNQPPTTRKAKPKPAVSYETERLKALLIEVIRRLLKYEPDAADLLKRVHVPDPEDDVDDLFTKPVTVPVGGPMTKPGTTTMTAKFDPRPIAEAKEPARKRLSARKQGT
jgi:hypothetical protein